MSIIIQDFSCKLNKKSEQNLNETRNETTGKRNMKQTLEKAVTGGKYSKMYAANWMSEFN